MGQGLLGGEAGNSECLAKDKVSAGLRLFRWADPLQLKPLFIAFTVATGAEFTVSVILHVFPGRQGEHRGGRLS